MSYSTQPRRPTMRGKQGPPAWFVVLIGIGLVFGAYYLWQGARSYLRSGGLGVVEATERAEVISTATAERVRSLPQFTPQPTVSPLPPCEDFVVSVPNAIVRETPSTNAPIITSYSEGTTICVIGREPDSEWYTIDNNPRTRRPDVAYMHETVIRAVNPTATPTLTVTPLPTITATPSLTPTITPSPRPSDTRIPGITDTHTPTLTPTATPPFQSA